ncbi:MAG: hypothetical protein AABX53_04595 [Nanoarchaeota archaeon]
MSLINQVIVKDLARTYQQELSQLYSREGVILVDNSFLNGFVRRRVQRDGVPLNYSEAWYLERSFHEGHAPEIVADNNDGSRRHISFPRAMIAEFSRGITRLERFAGDPLEALADRWGGPEGEPAVIEYAIDHVPDEEICDGAVKQLKGCIGALKIERDLFAVFSTEAFVAPSTLYPQRFETKLGSRLGRKPSEKRYHRPQAHLRVAHYQKNQDSADLAGRVREIIVRPVNRAYLSRTGHPDVDREIYLLALAIGQQTPATILTADNDFRSLHGFYQRNKPSGDPASAVSIVLDHGGVPEVLEAQP